MIKKTLIILCFATITTIGCSSDQDANKKADQSANKMEDTNQTKQDSPKLTETYWKLVSLQGEEVTQSKDQKEAHIILRSGEQKVTGNGTCNLLNGSYGRGNNNSITFSKMGTTMMSCPDMETEKQFLKILGEAEAYKIKSDSLMLNSDSDQTLAKFVSAEKREK